MEYLAVWKVLEEMITDFRKKGVAIPSEVMNNLKSAKTMINILRADASRIETAQRIEEYLGSVESSLVSEGQKRFGTKYAAEWLKRLDEAGRKTLAEEEEEAKFVPALPREQKWIRVRPSPELPIEKVKTLAEQSNLAYSIQKDGFLLVYGKDEQLKDFVKKMATKHKPKAKK